MARRQTVPDTIAAIVSLTARERRVLLMLLRGTTNKETGEALGISGRTVEVHRREILKKLRAESSIQLGYLVGLAVAASDPAERTHYP